MILLSLICCKQVCTVVDSAELCRNTHCDSEFVEEASRASTTMFQYLYRLNTNSVIYDAVVKVEQSNALTTEEAKRAAFTHRVEFERGGVHLCDGKQERIRQLHLQTNQLERKFMKNILEDHGHLDIFPASRAPKSIERIIKPIFQSESGVVKNGVRVITDSENLQTILKWVKDKEKVSETDLDEDKPAEEDASSESAWGWVLGDESRGKSMVLLRDRAGGHGLGLGLVRCAERTKRMLR
ncbi:hypothetical protein L7F22_052997 [Adiantum nelumboides]|nr:hypothetical protein [Adiantum nelumboides]